MTLSGSSSTEVSNILPSSMQTIIEGEVTHNETDFDLTF